MKAAIHLLLAFLLLQTAAYSENARPNFIIFIADDVSWDDFGAYGNRDVKTPEIDRLAANGLRFDNVYLTASSCSPSRNSILLGRYPHNTGAAELHTQPPLDLLSFPELLKENGYHTVHSGKYHQGEFSGRAFVEIHRDPEAIEDGGEGMWLTNIRERPRDKPFFMWFAALDAHREWGENPFSGVHAPGELTPPFYLADGEATKKDLAQYYDEVYRFDHHIGLVVDELREQDALDNTVIIVMADNGRPFPHSKTRVNDRGMKTPFIIYYPDEIPGQQQSSSLVSVIDIAPTILEMAGIDVPESFQGRSFRALLDDPDRPFRNYVFAEHNWHDYEAHERMVRNREFMYILNSRPQNPQMGPADAVGSPAFEDLQRLRAEGELSAIQADVFVVPRAKEELYDQSLDPLQLVNIASVPAHRGTLDTMRGVLSRWMEATGDSIPASLTPDWYLRRPGYVETDEHGIRGEMPGARKAATTIDAPGPF